MPADWKKSIILKIPRKGTRTGCNNWRGITFLSVPGKILAKIICKRICTAVDDHLRNYDKNRLVFEKAEDVLTTYLQCRTSLNSVQNGREASTPISLISLKHLIVCTGKHFGKFSSLMVSLIVS